MAGKTPPTTVLFEKKYADRSAENLWLEDDIWVFPKIVVPQNGWFRMKNPIKMDDLGVPLFLETSFFKMVPFQKTFVHFQGPIIQQIDHSWFSVFGGEQFLLSPKLPNKQRATAIHLLGRNSLKLFRLSLKRLMLWGSNNGAAKTLVHSG